MNEFCLFSSSIQSNNNSLNIDFPNEWHRFSYTLNGVSLRCCEKPGQLLWHQPWKLLSNVYSRVNENVFIHKSEFIVSGFDYYCHYHYFYCFSSLFLLLLNFSLELSIKSKQINLIYLANNRFAMQSNNVK